MDEKTSELIGRICSTLSREDWLLWAGYLIDHKADHIDLVSLAALIEKRDGLRAEMIEFPGLLGPIPLDRTMH